MSNSVQELNAKLESLRKQVAKVETAIAQAGFVDSLAAGAYVFGKLNDGTTFDHALVLGKTAAEGTSGVWYKLRLNEGTVDELVKSVRLSNIDGVEGVAAETTAEAAPTEAQAEEPKKAKKGALEAGEI
jgi:hypothetical protein